LRPPIGVEERRARLGVRHGLAPSARRDDPADVARALVGLHATDPASVFLGAAARMRAPTVGAIEGALYEDRSVVRMLGMRRTMFVVPVDAVPVVQAACTRAIAAAERRKLMGRLERASVVEDVGSWIRDVEEATLRALVARGEAAAAELSLEEPRLRTSVLMAEGKAYETRTNVSTWVLSLLAADGRIVRGRPRGSWISSQYRWCPLEAWLPGGMQEWPPERARVELARRWLTAFGPGTLDDLRWWTGWGVGQSRAAVAGAGAIEVDLGGTAGLVLADDLEPVGAPDPWVALLPALDSTAMGWAERDWFLGDHRPSLFDRSGNIGPTVWCDGRIVGGWAQRRSGEVAVRLLEDVGAEAAGAIEDAAARLERWLGGVRFTPRFRTPLERELAAGTP
jgi:hypothetical protein